MILSEKDKKICKKYSAYDETGHVHCNECPLLKGDPDSYDFRCKANSSYNRHTKEWEYDCEETQLNHECRQYMLRKHNMIQITKGYEKETSQCKLIFAKTILEKSQRQGIRDQYIKGIK